MFARLIAAVLACASLAAAEQRRPRHDPPDQMFRRAPMSEASRSVVVNLATNLHLAFDQERCRIHTVWMGGPLNLWGPPYSYSKSPFICDFDGKTIFSFPQRIPFSGEDARFEAIETQPGPSLVYRAGKTRVRERLRGAVSAAEWQFSREFHLPEGNHDGFEIELAAERGGDAATSGSVVSVRGSGEPYWITASGGQTEWRVVTEEVDYLTERITEQGTEKQNPRERYRGKETRVFLRFPHGVTNAVVTYANTKKAIAAVASSYLPRSLFNGGRKRPDSGDRAYRIEQFPLPPQAEMIVTGLDVFSNGDLVICTWLGEVYRVENATGAVERASYRRIAPGLNEPLGIMQHGGKLLVVQKGELTALIDATGDGVIDRFECVSADWGYSGNYHSYSFGPVASATDSFYVFVTGQRGRTDLKYQGWAIEIDPGSGMARPICDGLRVPHGVGTYQGALFVTDNQGNWIGACRLNHIRPGRFYGFPSSVPSRPGARPAEEVAPPALWFPRALSPSTSGFESISDDRFGPFNGQLIVGDFQNAILMRAFLEKVNGEWQGAVFPFAKGFSSGINRLKMNRDGKLYVGGGKRTWSTAAPSEWSLERVSFTGATPFEVVEARAETDGFTLTFTKPVDPEDAADPENYLVKQFGYKYHADYGSPEFDHEGKPGATELAVKTAEVGADRLSVRLRVGGLRAGYVTAIQLAISSANGEEPRHDAFYYTLNQIPSR